MLFDAREKDLLTSFPSMNKAESILRFASIDLKTLVLLLEILNSSKILSFPSLSFFDTNIVKNIYLPDLKAVKSWSSNTNELNYDESIYKIDSNTWVEQMPSVQDSFETFKKHKVDTAQTSLPLLPYLENYGFNQETPIAKKIHENGYFIPAYHRLNHKDLLRISSAVDDILVQNVK
mgnify:CR=1 FL=1